ncbi:hypothetical protein SK803_33310 [Lentzea sp. BCCO 10_0856]|uniref:Uncharacterized protein n=1 Tax=Lentzea miocenica TaxID=3095431 RepID=A0ABU4TAC2_9PSEU|nr:hypothetical protein [Lentzea sp. BCCO 10_0856]MDX8035117.1 hypothetical protein [Lentzea sp. BCCO 10_0856]
MKLEGERWRTLVSTVRLGRDEYRVVRPARPVAHASMHLASCGVSVTVNKAAAKELAMAWAFAMRSPRTLVYLPLRRKDCECRMYAAENDISVDLVLLHHSLGFPASRWKDVRARLRGGRPHTVVCRGLPRDVLWRGEARHREFRDELRYHFAADTAFFTGSWKAFAAACTELREMVEDWPRLMHEEQREGFCAEIWAEGMQGEQLHVQYCLEHRVSNRR